MVPLSGSCRRRWLRGISLIIRNFLPNGKGNRAGKRGPPASFPGKHRAKILKKPIVHKKFILLLSETGILRTI